MKIDIDFVISYMQVYENLKLPYDHLPGSFPGGEKPVNTFELWDSYQWNPPEYLPDHYPDFDPNASLKPNWEELLEALPKAQLQSAIERVEYVLKGGEIYGGGTIKEYKEEVKEKNIDNEKQVIFAHNRFMERYNELLSQANDTSLSINKRYKKALKLEKYILQYRFNLNVGMQLDGT